jgi:hypothetical protein
MEQQQTQQQQPNVIIPQRTEQWKRLRYGKLTSGHAYVFMGAKGAINETSKKFLTKKLMELIVGDVREIDAFSLAWGRDWEPFAKQAIANKYNSEYFEADYIQNPLLPYHGGSPDGIINIKGIDTTAEVKCPVFEEALTNRRLLKSVEDCKKGYPELYWQCQSNMYLQKTPQALAASFHPHVPVHLHLSDLIIPRNDKDIELMFACMKEAWQWMEAEAKELNIDILGRYAELSQPIFSNAA